MSRLAHRTLNAAGLEVRLTRNLERNRALEQRQQQQHSLRFLRNARISTVLDVGANEGQFLDVLRDVCPTARFYSFEPLPEIYAILESRFAQDPRVSPVNVALSASDGVATMYRSSFTPSSSLMKMAELHKREFPQSSHNEAVEIRTLTMDTWFAQQEPQPRDEIFVKLDVQGHELAVLAGAERTMRRTRFALIEVSFRSLYEGQPLFDEIYRRMWDLGFGFIGNIEQFESTIDAGMPLFADALFENRFSEQ